MDLNHFVISGNLTRDPELRFLPSGTATVTFSVACNFVRYDDNGAKHERTDFVPVTTFGKQAERDAKFLRKGSPVTVEGRIESWFQRSNKDEKRGGFNFKATNVQYGGRGPGNGQRSNDSGDAPGHEGSANELDEWVREYDTAESRQGTRTTASH